MSSEVMKTRQMFFSSDLIEDVFTVCVAPRLAPSLWHDEIIIRCSVRLGAPGTLSIFNISENICSHIHIPSSHLQLAGNNSTQTGRIYNTFMLEHLCCVPVGSNTLFRFS